MQRYEPAILSRAIEDSVRQRGVTPAAVWLDKSDALPKGVKRCEAIFRMIGQGKGFSVLDVGCGPGFAVDFLNDRYGESGFDYCGVDVSAALLAAAAGRFPTRAFVQRDISVEPLPEAAYDFTAINGVLTAKYGLPEAEMEAFALRLLEGAWRSTRVALSFNVMSPYVDWRRDDLFHWPIERAMGFCAANLSRHCSVLADYGLYEYTVQVRRAPIGEGPVPPGWTEASMRP